MNFFKKLFGKSSKSTPKTEEIIKLKPLEPNNDSCITYTNYNINTNYDTYIKESNIDALREYLPYNHDINTLLDQYKNDSPKYNFINFINEFILNSTKHSNINAIEFIEIANSYGNNKGFSFLLMLNINEIFKIDRIDYRNLDYLSKTPHGIQLMSLLFNDVIHFIIEDNTIKVDNKLLVFNHFLLEINSFYYARCGRRFFNIPILLPNSYPNLDTNVYKLVKILSDNEGNYGFIQLLLMSYNIKLCTHFYKSKNKSVTKYIAEKVNDPSILVYLLNNNKHLENNSKFIRNIIKNDKIDLEQIKYSSVPTIVTKCIENDILEPHYFSIEKACIKLVDKFHDLKDRQKDILVNSPFKSVRLKLAGICTKDNEIPLAILSNDEVYEVKVLACKNRRILKMNANIERLDYE